MKELELFIFFLSIFHNVDIILRIVRSFMKTPPQPFIIDWREKIIWGSTISYILTYILL